MIYINEWLPNPVGVDTAGEFAELYNNGPAVSLRGWALTTGKGKGFHFLNQTIAANGYLVLTHVQTKLTLKNSDGGLLLYSPDGRLADSASFVGAAPEGKSFSRVDYLAVNTEHFVFADPTTGIANKNINHEIAVRDYPTGVSLSHQLDLPMFFSLTLGISTLLLIFFIYATRKNKDISDLLFRTDEAVG